MSRELQQLTDADTGGRQLPAVASQSGHLSTAAMFQSQVQRWWGAFRRGWWIIALSVLVLGGAAISYALVRRPSYQSEVVLWVSSKLSLPGDQRSFAEDLASYMGTQAELLRNDAIHLRALERIRPRFPQLGPPPGTNELVLVPFKITTRSSMKSGMLEVEAIGASPDSTRAFLDAVVEEYFALKRASRQHASTGALSSITDQMKEVEAQIQKQDLAIAGFSISNNVALLTEQSQNAGANLSRLSDSISAWRTEYKILDSLTPEQLRELARSNDRAGVVSQGPGLERTRQNLSLGGPSSDNAYFQILQQMEVLRSRRDEFAKVLRPTHSKMVKLNQEIAGYEQTLKALKEEGSIQALAQVVRLRKSLELQIEDAQLQYHTVQTNAARAGRLLMDYERMKQERQRTQAIHDSMASLLQTVDLHNSADQDPLNPVAPASAARPVSRKLLIMVGGLFLGFMLGVWIVVLKEFLNDRFTSLTELSHALPEDVIGQIPESSIASHPGKPLKHQDPDLQHAFVESFRNLGMSLLYSFSGTYKPKVILISSAVPAEGKSTVASNLAATLARTGARVLLIDADLRRSSIHTILGVNGKPGLREVLGGMCQISDAIVRVDLQQPQGGSSRGQRDAELGKLYVVPAGDCDLYDPEVFLSDGMDQLLAELVPHYDHILIDTPPVLATSDIMSLVPKADYVLMVLRASYTSSRMLREALNRLYKCNVRALGVVYNRAAVSSDYFYRYSREYRSKPVSSGRTVLEPDVVYPRGSSPT
jgi:succinoglycan biosynthesis transport protein ExoP